MLTRSLITLPLLLAGLSACGGAPVMPEPEPEVICTASEKNCDGECVGLDRTTFGCGRSSCDACNHHDGYTHENELFICSAANANACELVDCNSGGGLWADCDENAFNGCELDLTADIDNCGACDNRCPDTPAAGAGDTTCSAGQCKAVCLPGRVDSDGLLENGCEGAVLFVEGDGEIDDCPAEIPRDESICEDVGRCAYYTPGTACVTTASCLYDPVAAQYWHIQPEHCDGRDAGAFCELDLECASASCSEHECLAAIGSFCTGDEECTSGACCPSESTDLFVCESACVLLPAGAACNWNGQCETGICNFYGMCGS